MVPWWAGGATTLGNLVLLCPKHHKLVEPPRMHHPPGRPPDGTRTSGRDSARERWEVRINQHAMPEFLPPERLDPTRSPIPATAPCP
ncbi:HNH endonuclease [Tessaracoccus sp. HDW20]|uniref:HNH endonuclease n=1 Tax=Tessaracoccus coleopterorum TaxID=2714950 RepID=UPI0018D424C6|nr:HNH endonuclease [Tessaracoccus coleopterorum]